MSFIEIIDGVLSPQQCEAIVSRFEADRRVRRGVTGSGVDLALKDSWDLAISVLPEWRDVAAFLNAAVMRALISYVRAYPFAAIAPHAMQTQASDGTRAIMDADRVRGLNDAEMARMLTHLFRPDRINLQKYIADSGGYPHWHSENYPESQGTDALHRVLAWTLYLNDRFEGGETEFFHQQLSVKPKTGSIALAPTGFTHTHRGNTPRGGDKYIATSWVLFQPAGVLYGATAPRRP